MIDLNSAKLDFLNEAVNAPLLAWRLDGLARIYHTYQDTKMRKPGKYFGSNLPQNFPSDFDEYVDEFNRNLARRSFTDVSFTRLLARGYHIAGREPPEDVLLVASEKNG